MKKIHLTLTIGLTLFLTSVCAEKYEYVKLRADGNTAAIQTITLNTLWDSNKNQNYQNYVFDQVELGNGDVAKIVSGVNYSVVFDDGNDVFMVNFGDTSNPQTMCVGPGRIYLTGNEVSLGNHRSATVTIAIQRASSTGSTTLAWSGTEWTNPNSSTQVANNNSSGSVQYDTLLGWCYFTDTPWLYSYTNGSWYYMKSINNEVYVWNANLPDGGWTKFRG